RAPTHRRRHHRAHRRHHRRLLALALVLAVVVAGLAATGYELRPRPGITWSYRAADGTLTVSSTERAGPLHAWLLGHTQLSLHGQAGGRRVRAEVRGRRPLVLHVAYGAHVRLFAAVEAEGIHRRATIALRTPMRLALAGEQITPDAATLSLSEPARRVSVTGPCGRHRLTQPSSTEVVLARSLDRCSTQLLVDGRDGQQATGAVVLPPLRRSPVYSFASAAGGAIYITVDDGWRPSPTVLGMVQRQHLPVTAFLIQRAAALHLAYWKAFAAAGGVVQDHTVSHPDLTKLSFDQATQQWAGAAAADTKWFKTTPTLGRPPYGALDRAVQASAARAGLTDLLYWSVVVDAKGIHTWNAKPLEAGEIVLLHWDPGLGSQMRSLLADINAAHLHPAPLIPASFAGVQPAIPGTAPGE
ncbi:MAG: polysaccharide deacetylase family protein, partial [Acidimicrobiales bacterium]